MRKKFFSALIAAAVVTYAGYNVYQSRKMKAEMSDTMLANVEALASSEGSSGATPCGGPKVNRECQSTNTINCKDLTGCQ